MTSYFINLFKTPMRFEFFTYNSFVTYFDLFHAVLWAQKLFPRKKELFVDELQVNYFPIRYFTWKVVEYSIIVLLFDFRENVPNFVYIYSQI